MALHLRSKSHPVESSWVSTTACKAPKTLSREERGVGGLLGNPEPPWRRERQQVVLSWYVTGKPFPPPQNTDSPERGWKVPCFRSNQHFRARCCTHSTRFATQGCSSPSCSMLGGGFCPVGRLRPGGRAGPQPGTGATMARCPVDTWWAPSLLLLARSEGAQSVGAMLGGSSPWHGDAGVAPPGSLCRATACPCPPAPTSSSTSHQWRWPPPPQPPQTMLGAAVALPVPSAVSAVTPAPTHPPRLV